LEAVVTYTNHNFVATSAHGTDIFLGVDKLAFNNGTLYGTAEGSGAQVNRLYEAVLSREADAIGHNDWVRALESGSMTLHQAAAGFVNSEEFELRFGGIHSPNFVENLYNNVLGRASDAEGAKYWAARIAAGDAPADLVLGFTESTEFKRQYDLNHPDGTMVLNESTIEIARIFQATHGRLPNADEFNVLHTAIDSGMSLRLLIKNELHTGEGAARYGTMSNTDFVRAIVTQAEGHGPVDAELKMMATLLDTGQATREALVWDVAHGHDATVNVSTLLTSDPVLG
jgi:hypothetical protein